MIVVNHFSIGVLVIVVFVVHVSYCDKWMGKDGKRSSKELYDSAEENWSSLLGIQLEPENS